MSEARGVAQSEASYEELKKWARGVDLPTPVPWAEVEKRILSEPVPSRQELDAQIPRQGILARLAWLFVLPEAVLVFGSSVIGLALVVAHVTAGRELPGGWDPVQQGIFIAAIAMAAFPVITWTTTRRRGAGSLFLAAGTAVASALSFVLLATASEIDRLGVWTSLQVFAAVATAVGVVSFIFLAIVGRPGLRLSVKERWGAVSPEEKWMRGQRAGVLEELRKRGLVNDYDSSAMLYVPRGGWRELTSLPDGRVVRHAG